METRTDSQTVSNLANEALRSKRLAWLTTTAAVAGVILTGIIASFSLKYLVAATTSLVEVANVVLAVVSSAVAGFGLWIYQRERKYESKLGDIFELSVIEGLERTPVSRRKLALELLFTIAEASTEKTRYRILDLSRLASTMGTSLEETAELFEHLHQSGFITVQVTPNEESVSLSHDLLAGLLLERRQKIILDLLAQASRNEPPNARFVSS